MGFGAHFQRGDERIGQRRVGALQVAVQAPGVVFHRVVLEAVVGLALLAGVAPAEGGLDAVAGVVGEGQADGAGGRDRQQVRIAQALAADLVAQVLRQARRKRGPRQVQVGVEQREGTALGGQIGAGVVGRVAHRRRDVGGHGAGRLGVVAQAQHHQRIAQPGEAQADTALGHRFGLLLRQRPDGDVEHVVEHADGHRAHLGKTDLVEGCVGLERALHEVGEVHAAQAAAAVGRQRLFATGVGRCNRLAITQVVVLVDAVEEQHARFGMVVGAAHDLVPQHAGAQGAVNPQAVGPAVGASGLGRR